MPNRRTILLDLASLNIQRGRDHGLPGYNSYRRFFGLKPYTKFSQITSDERAVKKLEECYKDINLLDAFIGLIAEDSIHGASVGELGAAIIRHTMSRVRAGDRLWYEYAFPSELIK